MKADILMIEYPAPVSIHILDIFFSFGVLKYLIFAEGYIAQELD